jgi:hypothetical protein
VALWDKKTNLFFIAKFAHAGLLHYLIISPLVPLSQDMSDGLLHSLKCRNCLLHREDGRDIPRAVHFDTQSKS